ncbi:hypothetical protein Tco_0943591, partial [Tanacetum coccineum]
MYDILDVHWSPNLQDFFSKQSVRGRPSRLVQWDLEVSPLEIIPLDPILGVLHSGGDGQVQVVSNNSETVLDEQLNRSSIYGQNGMTNETNVTAPVNVTGAPFLKETAPQVEPPAEGQPSNAQATTTAKELWESLERKYKTEDANTKKFVVAWFLDYKMDDSKTVITQVQDLQVLLHDIHAERMTLSETFQVAAIIEKLPPSWNDKKSKGKAEYLAPKAGIVKQKFQGTCYNYDQPGHYAANCKMLKR